VKIQGKVILVTGGAVRIGKAISKMLASKGARLAIHYNHSEKEAESLAESLQNDSNQIKTFQADLNKTEQTQKLVSEVEEKLGSIDVLINNAALFKKSPLLEVSEADWDNHLNINLKAPFFLSQAVSKKMLGKKEGKIINIADLSFRRPYLKYIPYSISKAGLIALTQSLAKELAPHIQVNAIALGAIKAPVDYSEEEKEKRADKTLLKRWGDPQDVANAICFLIEGADYASGSTLTLDGGSHLV